VRSAVNPQRGFALVSRDEHGQRGLFLVGEKRWRDPSLPPQSLRGRSGVEKTAGVSWSDLGVSKDFHHRLVRTAENPCTLWLAEVGR
jgi:hypothetical protein